MIAEDAVGASARSDDTLVFEALDVATGHPLQFQFYLSVGDAPMRLFDIRAVATAAASRVPIELTSSHFSDATWTKLKAVADFIRRHRPFLDAQPPRAGPHFARFPDDDAPAARPWWTED